jgi:hypothetical protein
VNTQKGVSIKNLFASCLGWVLVFLLLYLSNGKIPEFDRRLATFLSAALLTGLSIWVVYAFSCLKLSRQTYLLIGAISIAAVFLAAKPMVQRSQLINLSGDLPGQGLLITGQAAMVPVKLDKLALPLRNAFFSEISDFVDKAIPEPPFLIILLCLAQLALASGIGLWIAEGIEDITHLIPIALIATIADIWSVSAGATAKIVVSSSINYFLLRYPMPAYGSIPYLIGLTDFLFFAIFFQAAVRYELGALRNAFLLGSAFIIAVISALYTATGLPVLPFMAIFFVVGNFSRLQWKKEELKQVAVFVIVILILFAFISYKLH